MITDKKLEEAAVKIKEFNDSIKIEDYWAHGEPHSYKPTITKDQILTILRQELGTKA